MKIKIVEQTGENILVQLSVSWCGPCKIYQRELYDKGIKHIYINPEEKFVTKHFSSKVSPGDINLAKTILKKVGQIKSWPTFAVYKADGTVEVAEPSHIPYDLIKKYNIGSWK